MAQKKKMLTVRQYGSPIRREGSQKRTLMGLGLGKIGRTRQLEDTASIRGMVAKVAHMVMIIE